MTAHAQQHLTPEVEDVVSAYLTAVRAAMRGVDADVIDETIDGLLEHLGAELHEGSTADDARNAIRGLGAPESFSDISSDRAGEAQRSRGSGTLLGMPYDVRIPTAERVASRWWNPRDPRLFMPRAFGMGWDLNFGAAAVRLHLIEPDAEDEPFAQVSQRSFACALMVPVTLTAAMAVSYVWLLPELPAQLPSHWGISGQPDNWASRGWAFGMLFGLAAVPTVYALQVFVRRVSPVRRAVSIAFASLFSALSASLWLLTLTTVFTGFSAPWLPLVLITGALIVPAAVLVVLARIGRAAEIRSDIGRNR